MKQLFFFIFVLFSGLAFAEESENDNISSEGDLIPYKCIYSTKSGAKFKTKEKLCSQQSPDLAKKVPGVCVHQAGVWQRGTWDPSKKDDPKTTDRDERFILERVCDTVHTYEIKEESETVGPKLWSPDLVTQEDKLFTSKVSSHDSNKVPVSCYTAQDPNSKASQLPYPCSTDILSNDYCEFRDFTNEDNGKGLKINKRRLKGKWWVQFTDFRKRDMRICYGGVVLNEAQPELNPVYVKISNTPPLDFNDKVKICVRRDKKEVACEGENFCFLHTPPSVQDAWKQTLYNHIKTKYPTTAGSFRMRIGIMSSPLSETKLREWEPVDEEDEAVLNAANATENAAKFYKQAGSSVSITCEQLIVARPRP